MWARVSDSRPWQGQPQAAHPSPVSADPVCTDSVQMLLNPQTLQSPVLQSRGGSFSVTQAPLQSIRPVMGSTLG